LWPDGTIHWLSVLGRGIYDNSGRAVRMIGVRMEITDRKRIELSLSHSHNLMRYIIEHSPGSIAVFDKDLKYIYVSQQYLNAYQVDESSIIGKNHHEIFPDLPQKFKDAHFKALQGEIVGEDEDPYYREDGSVNWTRWECRPWYEADGTIGGIILYIEQITDRILQKLELIAAKEKAEESDRLKTAFLQNLSHEIRTPMNAIMGFSSLLKDNFNNKGKLEQFSSIISQRSNDLLDIINDILDVAKIESGQLPINMEELNLFDLFDDITVFFNEYKNRIGKQHIQFSLKSDCSDNEQTIITDKGKLKQILINLITNAFKFTDAGSVIVGCKTEKNNNMQFFVTDTGIGIPKDKQAIVFDRFSQLNQNPKKNLGGTGLGLPIVKGLVNLLGGEIFVESTPGEGSTFSFTIAYKIANKVTAQNSPARNIMN
jgi:PAS domain S-box-containing protein